MRTRAYRTGGAAPRTPREDLAKEGIERPPGQAEVGAGLTRCFAPPSLPLPNDVNQGQQSRVEERHQRRFNPSPCPQGCEGFLRVTTIMPVRHVMFSPEFLVRRNGDNEKRSWLRDFNQPSYQRNVFLDMLQNVGKNEDIGQRSFAENHIRRVSSTNVREGNRWRASLTASGDGSTPMARWRSAKRAVLPPFHSRCRARFPSIHVARTRRG